MGHVKLLDPGEEFGNWTVVGTAQPPLKRGMAYDCVCICGNKAVVLGTYLRSGQSTQCHRCASRNNPGRFPIPTPVGALFGSWTVIGPGKKPSLRGNALYYLCQCVCGTTRSVSGTMLRSGIAFRCARCADLNRSYEDFTGQRFNKWTVISRVPKIERPRDTNSWLCKCDCGTLCRRTISAIRRTAGCQTCTPRHPKLRPHEPIYRATKERVINRYDRSKPYDFSLTYEEFILLISTGRCHYCHTPIHWEHSTGGHHLDRKENSMGYSLANCVAACTRCNFAKGARYSYEEWWKMTACFREERKRKKPKDKAPSAVLELWPQ